MTSNLKIARALKRSERLRAIEAEAGASNAKLAERLRAIEAKVEASDAKLADAMKRLETDAERQAFERERGLP